MRLYYMRQLFIDLDGVLADFDGFYESQFGIKLDRAKIDGVENPDGMFKRINEHGTFFRDLPPMKDAKLLWTQASILHDRPIIITGTPYSVMGAEVHKREWVKQHIDPRAKVICCPSKEKYKHGKPGDVLIDDWHKYRTKWEEMGGIFILYKNRRDAIKQAYGLFKL